ncbi:MAG: UDP-N-acetylglucosamine 1-carboxyvinyltransferase [Ruminococcaceae bacterium]|nr:UDP-N-acetylglucosamine 1-carboxyvinyltransferase [Oscillospiraceae bacterium]
MSAYIINGGNYLSGEIRIGGAKNSVLPIMAASLLNLSETVLLDCPRISDVDISVEILKRLGCKVFRDETTAVIDSSDINNFEIPLELMNKMRSSFIFLGAMLAVGGKAVCGYPGGCELGARPIDMHLKAFKKLGVRIKEQGGYISCDSSHFKACKVALDFPSVGATENIMLLACKQKGTTTIINAAREPEISDLQNFLNSMGAKISGAGSNKIKIEGVASLKSVKKRIMPDRIVAATMMFAACISGGNITLKNVNCSHIESVILLLQGCGADIYTHGDSLDIICSKRLRFSDTLCTMPYPGFPTDAQAQAVAAFSTMEGTSIVKETIFENRFNHASELKKMGADITVDDRIAVIKGVKRLSGAHVYAPDLRGGAALVIAALGADGTTVVDNIHYIDRGYEQLDKMLSALGGDIKRNDYYE